MKKRKGVALVTVVMVFFITSVFMSIMITYFRNNVRMAVQQRYLSRAYYYTQAGIELATAALYTNRENPGFDHLLPVGPGNEDTFTMFDDFNNNAAHLAAVGYSLTDTITFYRIPNDPTSGIVAITQINITRRDATPLAVTREWWVDLTVSADLFDISGTLIVDDYRGRASFSAETPAINTRVR